MAIVNSKERILPMPEVIVHALADAVKRGVMPERLTKEAAILSIVQELQMDNVGYEQIGNTLYIWHYSPDRVEVAIRALNADTARNYVESTYKVTQKLHAEGVRRLTSDFKDKAILQMLKSVSRQDFAKNWGMKVYKNPNGMMRAYVVMPESPMQ